MGFIVSINGKGGAGKTTVSALILDELVRVGCKSVLAIDADPATTLHMALGIPKPENTIATIADVVRFDAQTLCHLSRKMTRAEFVQQRMQELEVLATHPLNGSTIDHVALGQRAERGCYCTINTTLGLVLRELVDKYDLVLIDNEAGLEHLNRHRLTRADLFLIVVTPGRASMEVGLQVVATAREMGMGLGSVGIVANRDARLWSSSVPVWAHLPVSPALENLDRLGQPAVALPGEHRMRLRLRASLQGVLDQVCV